MKTKFFSLLFATLASINSLFAQSGTCGNNLTWAISDSVLTISGAGEVMDMEPEQSPWFAHTNAIKAVHIEDGVTRIGHYAFAYCWNANSIIIPNSVTSIGNSAFYNCGIFSITIPNSIKHIGNNAFQVCEHLRELHISDLESWCNIDFGYEYANPLEVAHRIFLDDQEIQTLTIPNSIDTIKQNAFIGGTSFKSIIIPQDVKVISNSAFYGCDSILSVTFSDGLEIIGSDAFGACYQLNAINLPNSLTKIGYGAFRFCNQLSSVTIPQSTTIIEDFAFYDCSSLAQITNNAEVPQTIKGNVFDGVNKSSCILYVPESSINSYKAATAWNSFANIQAIDNTIHHVLIGDLYYNLDLNNHTAEVTFDVEENGDSWYYNYPQLKAATIPSSVSYGGTIYSVTRIGELAFVDCDSLLSVNIPYSVISIDERAFSDCDTLTTIIVDIANPVYDSRENCNAIIETSSNRLIVGCQNTIIPNSVISIGMLAFKTCPGLTSIVIPNNVTKIEDEAFWGCWRLTDVTISNRLDSIGSGAFSYCNSLETITIPESVVSIGSGAFWITPLRSVFCKPTTPPHIGSILFQGPYAYNRSPAIYVPCGALENYRQADGWTLYRDSIQYAPIPYQISAHANEGWVNIQNNCDHVTLTAYSNIQDYEFKQWSDGNTENPRNVIITQDTTFTAEFGISTSGICGDSAFWSLDTLSKVLTISGSGAMYDETPWAKLSSYIQRAEIEEGITYLSTGAFQNNGSIRYIHLPSTLQTIGNVAFYCAGGIESIVCDALTPPQANTGTFKGVNSKAIVYIPCGSKAAYLADTYGWHHSLKNFEDGSYIFEQDTAICGGEIISWRGHKIEYSMDTIEQGWNIFQISHSDISYADSMRSQDGCDSIYVLHIHYFPSYHRVEYDTLYEGYPYYWDGRKFTSSGVYVDTLKSYHGCDSIKILYLTFLPKPQYTISVSANSSKYGSVEGAGTFVMDTTITITAIPNKGYQFNQWSDGNTDNPRQVTVTQDATYTAIFGVKMCSWLVESNDLEMGAIITTFNNDYYQYGTQITVEASPNSGYKFVKWNDGKKFNPYKFSILEDKYLLAIFMEEEEEQDTTTVTPTSTTATFTWPFIVGGFSYSLTIYLDVACTIPFCTISFNQYGQFIGITFGNRAPRRNMEQEDGFTYTVSGLDANTEYYFKMETMDEDNKLINTDEGSFRTQNGATGIEYQQSDMVTPYKVTINGQIFILRGDKTYTITGQEVK